MTEQRGERHLDHEEYLDEAIDGGGCAEAWEALSARRSAESGEADGDRFDLEGVLLATDCLEPADGDDLELVDAFRTAWRSAVEDVEDDPGAIIGDALDVDGDVRIRDADRPVRARLDDRVIAEWVTRPAMVADLAASRLLADRYDGWETLSTERRGRLAGGLRLYLDFCPDCGGPASFAAERVESCCTDYEVATVACEDCGTTLVEIPVEAEQP